MIKQYGAVLWRKPKANITYIEFAKTNGFILKARESLHFKCNDGDSYLLSLADLAFESEEQQQHFLANFS